MALRRNLKIFKTSDGAELSYISAGRGKSIVLIHGWSQSAEQFKYQKSAFAERYHVVAVDLRGHGLSFESHLRLSNFSDKPFFMGDKPTTLDAIAYAYIGNFIKPLYGSPIVDYLLQLKNLCQHYERMKSAIF